MKTNFWDLMTKERNSHLCQDKTPSATKDTVEVATEDGMTYRGKEWRTITVAGWVIAAAEEVVHVGHVLSRDQRKLTLIKASLQKISTQGLTTKEKDLRVRKIMVVDAGPSLTMQGALLPLACTATK